MFKRLWVQLTTPNTVRMAQEKRRLERIARDTGCSRKQASSIVAAYFEKPLAKTSDACHNDAVTVERDVRSTPSSKACAGCASEKSAPCESTDSLIREVDTP